MARIRYPYLKLKFYDTEDNDLLTYLPKALVTCIIKPFIVLSETEEVEIGVNDLYFDLGSLDTNIQIYKSFGHFRARLLRDGSATLTCTYNCMDENVGCLLSNTGVANVSLKTEVIIYGDFFRNNYSDIMPSYDAHVITNTTELRVIFDHIMEFFDILFAYQADIAKVRNPIQIKYKFLNALGNSLGFGSLPNMTVNTATDEIIITRLYRELLNNLLDLLKIRGTKASYELFFGALGYDVDILEYWFDANGNLIEMNPDDPSASTFENTTVDGIVISASAYDPRKNVSPATQANVTNKSPYIKPIFRFKDGYDGVISYSSEQQILIKEYLELLRPEHIKYLTEIVTVLVPGSGANDVLPRLYDGPEGVSLTALLMPYVYYNYDLYQRKFAEIYGTWSNVTNLQNDDDTYTSTIVGPLETSDNLIFENLIDSVDDSQRIYAVVISIEGSINHTTSENEIVTTVNGVTTINDTDINVVTTQNLIKLTSYPLTYDEVAVYVYPELLPVSQIIPTNIITFDVHGVQTNGAIEDDPSLDQEVAVEHIFITYNANAPLAQVPLYLGQMQVRDGELVTFNANITPLFSAWDLDLFSALKMELYVINESLNTYEIQFTRYISNLYTMNSTWIIDLRPHFINNSTQITSRLPYNYDILMSDVAGTVILPDPGRLDYDGVSRHGTYSMSGGGMVVETLRNFNESIILGNPLNLSDILQTIPRYDTGLYYDGYVRSKLTGAFTPDKPLETTVPPSKWNDSNWMGDDVHELPTINNLFYDSGILLDEVVPDPQSNTVLSINQFQADRQSKLTAGYSSDVIKSLMMQDYNITSRIYDYLLTQ